MENNQATSRLKRVIINDKINDKMADESPPPNPKETDPLRNRISVFEKQISGPKTPPNPPLIRPKPGKISWTPKPSSPPPSPSSKDKERGALAKDSISAADAEESTGVGIGGRVAGLDGKSGFGPEILDLEEQEGRRRAEVATRMQRVGGVRIWRGFRGVGPKPSLRQTSVPRDETRPGISPI